MALTIQETARTWNYQSAPVAVAAPITIQIPEFVGGFTYTVSTDVGGTGTINISGDVNNSGNVSLGETPLNIASVVAQTYNGKLSSITFTPLALATATTYTIHIYAVKVR